MLQFCLIAKIKLTSTGSSSSSPGLFAKGSESGSRQRAGMAGDMMGCWNIVVTVVEEQIEDEAMDVTSMAVLLGPL